jgi:hypothetical protein
VTRSSPRNSFELASKSSSDCRSKIFPSKAAALKAIDTLGIYANWLYKHSKRAQFKKRGACIAFKVHEAMIIEIVARIDDVLMILRDLSFHSGHARKILIFMGARQC